MPKLRRIVKVTLLVAPVLITVYDQVGYVGIVRGCSMQVRNNFRIILYSTNSMHVEICSLHLTRQIRDGQI